MHEFHHPEAQHSECACYCYPLALSYGVESLQQAQAAGKDGKTRYTGVMLSARCAEPEPNPVRFRRTLARKIAGKQSEPNLFGQLSQKLARRQAPSKRYNKIPIHVPVHVGPVTVRSSCCVQDRASIHVTIWGPPSFYEKISNSATMRESSSETGLWHLVWIRDASSTPFLFRWPVEKIGSF